MDNNEFEFKEDIKINNDDIKEVNINDAIIKEENITELTEEDRERRHYDSVAPEQYTDDIFHATALDINEMIVNPHKEKKDGGTYYSSFCTLFCFDDIQKLKLLFFVENFKNYNPDTDELTVRGDNVLCRLINKLKGEDNDSNMFVTKFSVLREVICNTTDIDLRIKEIERNGYINYTIY